MNTGSFSVVVVVVAVDSLPRACTHVSTPDSFPERRLLLLSLVLQLHGLLAMSTRSWNITASMAGVL